MEEETEDWIKSCDSFKNLHSNVVFQL